MRRPHLMLALAVVAAALAGCRELLPRGFPHRAHLTEEACGEEGQPPCPTCASCHQVVREERIAERPGVEVCERCHEDQAARLFAEVRHASAKRTEIVFSHPAHLEQPSIRGQCIGCHAGVVDDGARGNVFPPMQACLDCHEDGLQADACSSCHQRRDLRALVPETFLRHDRSFLRDHGLAAARHEEVCTTCHAESDCVRCHEQSQPMGLATAFPEAVDRPFIHRADFVVRHAIEARSERDCARCHQPSFCDSCHLERGVSGNRRGSLNPHPIGWVGPDPGAATFHGRAARRDILSCAGCHDAGPATNCIRCHRVGGHGGNPHPAGWQSLRSPDAPMCRYCHAR